MTHAKEYKVFHDNFDKLCDGVKEALPVVTQKAFSKRLISSGNVEKAGMLARTEYERSSELVMVLLKRIERNTEDFYTILDIFRSQPVLENVVKLLEQPLHQAGVTAPSAKQGTATAVAMTPNDSSPKLQERPSTKQAFSALVPVADKWKQVGAFLEIPRAILGSIQNESNTDRDRLLALISYWLTTIKNVNWKSLIEAVEMADEHQAQQIRIAFL